MRSPIAVVLATPMLFGCNLQGGMSSSDQGSGGRSNICVEGLNSQPCWTGSAFRYVSTKGGGDVTVSESLSATIPQGYYPGSIRCEVQADNISAENIKDGVEILGVKGSLSSSPAALASNMHRTAGTTQLTLQEEAIDHSGTNVLPGNYRPVPSILTIKN